MVLVLALIFLRGPARDLAPITGESKNLIALLILNQFTSRKFQCIDTVIKGVGRQGVGVPAYG